MLKFSNKLLLVCLLSLIPALGMAQQPAQPAEPLESQEGEEVKVEKEAFSPIPEALRVGIDVSRLLGNMVNPNSRYYEANADLTFGRYLLSADWGTGKQTRTSDIVEYRTSGSFFRIGPDVNFIQNSADHNALFFGLRYARSNYEEKLNTTFKVPGWEMQPIDPERTTSARWFEGVVGLRARVWNNFYLGYTMRYKFWLKIHNEERFISYEVPGFGKVGDGNTFSFNYHILYRIPFN